MPRLGSDRGSTQAGAAVAAAALMLLAVVLAGAGTALLGGQAACGAQAPASGQATGTIPASYLTLYQQAGRQTGVPWPVLAGIGEAESDHGRSAAGNTWGGAPIHPATQHTGGYGTDGDHDGQANVYDPADAIPAAAVYLKPTARPVTSPQPSSRTTTRSNTSPPCWAGPPATPPAAPRPSPPPPPRLRSGRRRAAAPRDSREGHRIRPSPARKAVPMGRHRAGRVRLLRAGHDGLPRRRDHHPPHQPAAMGHRTPHPPRPRKTRRPRLLRRLRRDHDRPRPRRHRHQQRDDDRRPQAGETVRQEPYGNSTDLVGFARPASG